MPKKPIVKKTKSTKKVVAKKPTKIVKKAATKKPVKKLVKKEIKKPVKKVSKVSKVSAKKVESVSSKPKRLKDNEVNEIIGVLKAKNDIRGFVTFGEILNLIKNPEVNIDGLDKIFDILFKDNVTITKNLDILEVDREISIEDLVKSTTLEE
jgi:hypothetical protein